MDYADDDAVSRFEMWDKALTELVLEEPPSANRYAAFIGDTSFVRMKQQAVINAARIEGDAHLARVQKAFPGLDLLSLVQALRVKVVEMRLEGRL